MKLPCTIACLTLVAALSHAAGKPRPLLRDFIGLNGHTVQFKPELYAPVAKRVRDYHPLKWDLGDETDFATTFPFARNRVDWSKVYGSWLAAGQRVNACLMFDDLAPTAWKDLPRDAAAYGEAFGRYFGPAGKALVEAVEIGNEPGKYSDTEYRALFTAMAGALRQADPRLLIATCAANLGPSGRYSKSVDAFAGLGALYDVVSVHIYAEAEPWPTWRRSYPEDPETKFLENLGHVLEWRAQHAPDKEVWLTEFGWDATTKPPPKTGDFAKWQGSTETQQAQWIVRAWLLCAAIGVDRAYLYFFNDDDTPQLHGSSGLTRNFQPKPAYHAAAWLQRSLGDYRFSRTLPQPAGAYAYEFTHGTEPSRRVLAVWKAKGEGEPVPLPVPRAEITRAERMPLAASPAEAVEILAAADGTALVPAGESPVFLWIGAAPDAP